MVCVTAGVSSFVSAASPAALPCFLDAGESSLRRSAAGIMVSFAALRLLFTLFIVNWMRWSAKWLSSILSEPQPLCIIGTLSRGLLSVT